MPGSKEEWKIKISGPKGEKVAAEMLATMYDASLDAFASNSIYMNVYRSNYSQKHWGSNCFGSKQSQLHSNYWNEYLPTPVRTYDALNWWGYNYSYRNYYSYNFVELDGAMGSVSYSWSEADAPMEESATGELELKSKDARVSKNLEFSSTRDQSQDFDITTVLTDELTVPPAGCSIFRVSSAR